MKSLLTLTTALTLATAAQAGPLSLTSGVGMLPSFADPVVLNFDGPPPAGFGLSFTGPAGIRSGWTCTPGCVVPATFSGGQGAAVGEGGDGLDTSPYLYASVGGRAEATFPGAVSNIYGILSTADWQNTVAVLMAGGAVIGTVGGGDIAHDPGAPGCLTAACTFGFNITSAVPATGVAFYSGKDSIEIAALAIPHASSVPEPGALALLLSGLLGLAMIRPRARRAALRSIS